METFRESREKRNIWISYREFRANIWNFHDKIRQLRLNLPQWDWQLKWITSRFGGEINAIAANTFRYHYALQRYFHYQAANNFTQSLHLSDDFHKEFLRFRVFKSYKSINLFVFDKELDLNSNWAEFSRGPIKWLIAGENLLLVSISFSILSMISNNFAFPKTLAAKQTNIIRVADVVQMPSIYSMKSLAT